MKNNLPQFYKYHITGVLVSGKRFKIVTSSFFHAAGINLWRGTVWGVRKNGTRTRLWEVTN